MLNLRQGPKVASCGRRMGCLEASSRSCIRGAGPSKLKFQSQNHAMECGVPESWDIDTKGEGTAYVNSIRVPTTKYKS